LAQNRPPHLQIQAKLQPRVVGGLGQAMLQTFGFTGGQFVVAGFAQAAQGRQGRGSVPFDNPAALINEQFRLQIGQGYEIFRRAAGQPKAQIGAAQPRPPAAVRIGDLPADAFRRGVDGKIQRGCRVGGGCGGEGCHRRGRGRGDGLRSVGIHQNDAAGGRADLFAAGGQPVAQQIGQRRKETGAPGGDGNDQNEGEDQQGQQNPQQPAQKRPHRRARAKTLPVQIVHRRQV